MNWDVTRTGIYLPENTMALVFFNTVGSEGYSSSEQAEAAYTYKFSSLMATNATLAVALSLTWVRKVDSGMEGWCGWPRDDNW